MYRTTPVLLSPAKAAAPQVQTSQTSWSPPQGVAGCCAFGGFSRQSLTRGLRLSTASRAGRSGPLYLEQLGLATARGWRPGPLYNELVPGRNLPCNWPPRRCRGQGHACPRTVSGQALAQPGSSRITRVACARYVTQTTLRSEALRVLCECGPGDLQREARPWTTWGHGRITTSVVMLGHRMWTQLLGTFLGGTALRHTRHGDLLGPLVPCEACRPTAHPPTLCRAVATGPR